MPKRSSKKPRDVKVLAASIVERSTGSPMPSSDATESAKNPAAVSLGRLGGLRGGPATAAKLTPEQRSEKARKAAQARWGRESREQAP